VIACFCAETTHGSSIARITAVASRARSYKYEEEFIEALLMRWIIAVLLAFLPINLLAQTDSHAYVFGGATGVWEEGATRDESRTYLEAPGGWSGGIVIGGGVHLARAFSIEAEWQRTSVMEQIEPSRYFITYSAQRRDTMIGFGGRGHVRVSGQVVFEPVAVFEFVREESWLAERRDVTPGQPSEGDLTDHAPFVNSWGTGLAGGVDLRAGGKHLAVLPGLRFHRFWRDAQGDASGTWPGGVSKWGAEVSVALRADF
jgi:hypothetical protein